MAISEIVDIAEVLSFLNKGFDSKDRELGLVQQAKKLAERSVRSFVGCNLVQGTYTHILPSAGLCVGKSSLGDVLRTPEWPIRSISALYEDTGAYGGAGTDAFSSADLLTAGTDYYMAVDQTGLSFFGHVVRLKNNWPAIPGSIKIEYTAGWSSSELDGDVDDPRLDVSDIKLATLKVVADLYNDMRRKSSGGVTQEKIGDYFISYNTETLASGEMSKDSRRLLSRFKRRLAG